MSVKILTPLSAAERWKKGVFPTLQQPESQPMSEEEVVPLEKCMQRQRVPRTKCMHHLSGGQASDALFSAKGFVTVALGRAKEPPRPAQEARATRAAANMHGVMMLHS